MPTQQELKQEGNIHFQNDDFEKAIEYYTLAIEKDAFCDDAAPILSNRSLCYYNIGKYKEAYEDAGCCCGIRPDWAKGFARRGAAAEKLKEWQIALESYDEYLKLSERDEMNVKNKQKNAKKIVDAIEKKKCDQEKELNRIDQQLTAMKDGTEEKQMKAYSLFLDGVKEMIIDKVELAVKHGVDLGRRWLSETLTISPFTNVLFAAAERTYQNTSDWHLKIHTGASFAVGHLVATRSSTEDSQFEQTSLLAKQRDFLDRLLDLVDKQHTKYAPAVLLMNTMIKLLFSAGNKFPFRTDFFLLLNTERGKNFFVGDMISMKKWIKKLVHNLLLQGTAIDKDPANNRIDHGEPRDCTALRPVGAHLRRLLESLEMGLQGISAQDLNTKLIKYHGDVSDARYLLDVALVRTWSAEVLELFLRRGANPNVESTRQNFFESTRQRKVGADVVPFSVLDNAFLECHSCARVLLSYGAKVRTMPTPSWILEHPFYTSLTSSSSSAMLLPQQVYYHRLPLCMLKTSRLAISRDDPIDQQSVIRVLFDAMTEQNVSFIGVDDENHVCTPMSLSIHGRYPLELIKVLLKVRPKLLNTPVPSSLESGRSEWVIYPVGCIVEMLIREQTKQSLDYYKDVMKLMFDVSEFSYDEFPAMQTENSLVCLAQYVETQITEYEEPITDTESKQKLMQLKAFRDFCINYRKDSNK